MKKSLTIAVMCFTALSSIAGPASAAVTLLDAVPDADPPGLNDANLATATAQCNALAASMDTDGPGPASDQYSAGVIEGPVTLVSGPTEVGTHTIGDAIGGYEPADDATFTPAHVEILGDPYRNGGSVNMFGLQQSVGGYYTASKYDFEGEFTTTYAHPYTCEVFVEEYTAAHVEHHNAVGIYVVNGDFGDSEGAVRGNCAAFTAQGDAIPQPEWYGEPFHGGNDNNPHCRFEGTPASDEEFPETWSAPVSLGYFAGGSFDQVQTDTLLAHESHGEGYFDSATVLIGQTVVCISPTTSTQTKKGAPGTWVLKNGYTGDKCTTAWYDGTSPYSTSDYAGTDVPNLNDGSHNWVTVPLT